MILCQMTTIHQLLSKSLETDTTKCRNALDYVLRLSLEINSKLHSKPCGHMREWRLQRQCVF